MRFFRSAATSLALAVVVFASVNLVPVAAAPCAGPTFSGGKETVTFCFTGAAQTWTVPAGVTSATFSVSGAPGGGRAGNSIAAGGGGGLFGGGGGAAQECGVGGGAGGGSGRGPAGVVFTSGVRAGDGLVAVTFAIPLPAASASQPPIPWLPIG